MRSNETRRRYGRLVGVLLAAVLGGGVLVGSQAVAAPLDPFVLASGQHGHPVSATVQFGMAPQGPTSHELVIGEPGSTDEIDDDAHLPATSVWRPANQVDSGQRDGLTSLTVTFTPPHPGDYPVFVFGSREMGCASGNMADETTGFSIIRVGLVRVR